MLKLSQLNMNYVDNHLSGRQFEFYCADLIHLLSGYTTHVTPSTNDHGLDIIYNSPSLVKNVGVQVKLTHGNSIGYAAEEEVTAGVRYYHMVGSGVVLTNGLFSSKAQHNAKRLGVTLWNRRCLNKFIHDAYNMLLEKQIFSKRGTLKLDRSIILDIQVITRIMGFKNINTCLNQMINEYKEKHINTPDKISAFNKLRNLEIQELKIEKKFKN